MCKTACWKKQAFYVGGPDWRTVADGASCSESKPWLYLLQGTRFSPSHWGLTPVMLDVAGCNVATERGEGGKNTLILTIYSFSYYLKSIRLFVFNVIIKVR